MTGAAVITEAAGPTDPAPGEIAQYLTERGYIHHPHQTHYGKHLFQHRDNLAGDASLEVWGFDPVYFNYKAYTIPVFEVKMTATLPVPELFGQRGTSVDFECKFFTVNFADLRRYLPLLERMAARIAEALLAEKGAK